jgi:uncharacterized protein (TIGR03382 family)
MIVMAVVLVACGSKPARTSTAQAQHMPEEVLEKSDPSLDTSRTKKGFSLGELFTPVNGCGGFFNPCPDVTPIPGPTERGLSPGGCQPACSSSDANHLSVESTAAWFLLVLLALRRPRQRQA